MKKVICLVLSLFFINSVQAMEYTEYGEFGPYTDEYIQSDDLTDVQIERRYKYYRLKNILGIYNDKTTTEYPFMDKEDFIYTNYSNLNPIYPEEKENREIETVTGYRYKKMKDINYMHISVVTGPITLSDINITYKGEKVDYTASIDTSAKPINLNNGETIKLNFNEKVPIYDLVLSINTHDGIKNKSLLHISFGDDNKEYGLTYITYIKPSEVAILGKDLRCKNSSFETYYSEEKLISTFVMQRVEELTLYKYREKLYRTYNVEREYYNEYLTQPYENYTYKDENLYKDYYSKRVRTMINKVISPKEENIIEDTNNNTKNINKQKQILQPLKTIKPKETKTNEIKKLEKRNYYPITIDKIKPEIQKSTPYLLYTFIPFILIFVILILVLSKLYKNKKQYAKVKTG